MQNVGMIIIYLHLPSIFPIKCVGGPECIHESVVAPLCKSTQATYIVLLSTDEVVDVNC